MDVIDTGIGIEPAHLSTQSSTRSNKARTTITRRFGGLGLGLAISRSIAEGHGGEYLRSVEQPGRRSRLDIHTLFADRNRGLLPDRPGPDPDLASEELEIEAETVILSNPLYVEDDAMTARIMAKLLRQNGYLVTTANSVTRCPRNFARATTIWSSATSVCPMVRVSNS